MSSNQPIPDPSQANIFAPLESAQETPPFIPPVHEQTGPGQQGSNLTVRKVVRPVHGQGEQNHTTLEENTVPPMQAPAAPWVKEAAQIIRPAFPEYAQVPPTPTKTKNNGLRLRSFTSSGIDFLPTTNLPIADNNNTSRQQQNQAAGIAASNIHAQQPQQPQQPLQTQQQNYPQQPYTAVQTRNTAGNALPVTPPEGVHILPGTVRSTMGTQVETLADRKHVVLHRAPNFFVATVARAGIAPPSLRRRSGQTTILPAFAPQQSDRVAASETRIMPKIGLINPIQPESIPLPRWVEVIVVVISLIAAGIAHAYNMFNYPQYSLDEGTYMSSAWAIVHGMLAPYPYGYGHPPLGWIQIAAWIQLTGGFFTFGDATNSGRVLMMFYSVGSSLLVYLIMRRLNGSRIAALLALVIFSFSPLCIAYHRLVLLDNIATFWLLLSLYFIVVSNSRLLFMVFAAVAFGFSLLSKEVMLLFFPAMIYAVWLHTTKFQRKFALVAFIYCFVAIGSTFILMAILRGELLPPISWLPGDTNPHLSLFSTYLQQAQRGQSQGSLSVSFGIWNDQDMLFIILAISSPIFNLIAGWKNRKVLLIALLSISFWTLFVRNGVVFAFYIIPLLPLSAFNSAIALNTILKWLNKLTRLDLIRVVMLFVVIAAITTYDLQHSSVTYTSNLTFVQTNALTWVRNNVPHNAVVVINSYFYTDLHEQGGEGVGNGTIFQHADIYWNVAYDPELHDGLLDNNWDNIDYIVTDAPMKYDIQNLGGDMNLINQALQHSFLRVDFRPTKYDVQDAIQIYQVIHKNAASFMFAAPTFITGKASGAYTVLTNENAIYAPDAFPIDTRKTNKQW
ncbi:MAG: phospholipid carrier-dependent glycosyltransferase [Ktedonobacteraceae bacterium]